MKNRTDSNVGEKVRSQRIKEKGGKGEEEEDVQTLLQLFNKLEIKEGANEETGNSSKEEKGVRHKQEERVQDAQYQSPRTRWRAGWEAEKLREPEQKVT